MSEDRPTETLDCTGLYCPEPVFKTRIELDRIEIGEVLEVLADDPAAEEDIKSLVKRLNYELLSFSKNNDVFRFLIKKISN